MYQEWHKFLAAFGLSGFVLVRLSSGTVLCIWQDIQLSPNAHFLMYLLLQLLHLKLEDIDNMM